MTSQRKCAIYFSTGFGTQPELGSGAHVTSQMGRVCAAAETANRTLQESNEGRRIVTPTPDFWSIAYIPGRYICQEGNHLTVDIASNIRSHSPKNAVSLQSSSD